MIRAGACPFFVAYVNLLHKVPQHPPGLKTDDLAAFVYDAPHPGKGKSPRKASPSYV